MQRGPDFQQVVTEHLRKIESKKKKNIEPFGPLHTEDLAGGGGGRGHFLLFHCRVSPTLYLLCLKGSNRLGFHVGPEVEASCNFSPASNRFPCKRPLFEEV